MWTDAEQDPREQKRSQLGLKWMEITSDIGWEYDLGMNRDRASGGDVPNAAAQHPPYADLLLQVAIHSLIHSSN